MGGNIPAGNFPDTLVIITINTKAVVQRFSVKKVFLEITQNSQENTYARVSFLIKLQASESALLKKRLWHRCFPVNFAKFLRATFFTEQLRWLLLLIVLLLSTLLVFSYCQMRIRQKSKFLMRNVVTGT